MDTGNHHILIIEDEQPIRRFLRASLKNEGYRISEAATANEGLQTAAAQPPDLIILDLGLPDLDGQDVLQQLRPHVYRYFRQNFPLPAAQPAAQPAVGGTP